jgi:hypothetical protein
MNIIVFRPRSNEATFPATALNRHESRATSFFHNVEGLTPADLGNIIRRR